MVRLAADLVHMKAMILQYDTEKLFGRLNVGGLLLKPLIRQNKLPAIQ